MPREITMARKAPSTPPSGAGPGAPIPSAEELRMKLLDAQMKEMQRREKTTTSPDAKIAQFNDDFLNNQVSDDERALIRRVVMHAVEKGFFEALVYSFPSKLCTDNGRAINNSEANWPD